MEKVHGVFDTASPRACSAQRTSSMSQCQARVSLEVVTHSNWDYVFFMLGTCDSETSANQSTTLHNVHDYIG